MFGRLKKAIESVPSRICKLVLFASLILFHALHADNSLPFNVPPVSIVSAQWDATSPPFPLAGVGTIGPDNFSTNSLLTIFENQSGQFVQTQQYGTAPAKSHYLKAVVGNLTGIEGNDIAILSNSPGQVFIFQNNNDGTFKLTATISLLGAATDIAVGYFTPKGLNDTQDLVVANTDASFTVIRNTHAITFSLTTIPTSNIPTCIAAANIDNNTSSPFPSDSVIVGYGGMVNQIETFEIINPPTNPPTFPNRQVYSVGKMPARIVAADFQTSTDTPIFADLAVTNAMDNTVSVLLNKKTNPAAYNPAVNYAVGNLPLGLTPIKLQSGFIGIAVANQASSTVSLLQNKGNGTFQAAVPFSAGSGPVDVTANTFFSTTAQSLAVSNAMDSTVTFVQP